MSVCSFCILLPCSSVINSEGFQGSLQGSCMYRVTSPANEDALALPFLVVSHFRPPPPHPIVLAATRLC